MAPDIASRRDRVRAGFVDGLLFLPLVLLLRHVAAAGWDMGPNVAYFLASWQVGWIYAVGLHGWRGQTVGKAILGIRVVRHSSRGRLGWARAIIRESPYIGLVWASSAVWVAWNLADAFDLGSDELDTWADQLLDGLVYFNLAWLGLEFVTMALHPERRAIHDLLAGSVVINAVPTAVYETPEAKPRRFDSPRRLILLLWVLRLRRDRRSNPLVGAHQSADKPHQASNLVIGRA